MRGRGIGDKVGLFAFCRGQSDRQRVGVITSMLATPTSIGEAAVDGTCVACERPGPPVAGMIFAGSGISTTNNIWGGWNFFYLLDTLFLLDMR